jgi:hypothetical protein
MINMWLYRDIIGKLRKRFNLVAYKPDGEYYQLGRYLQPIIGIEDLFKEQLIYPDTTITSITATGYYVAAVVPYNERWEVHFMRASVASGTFTIDGFRIGDGTNNILIYLLAAGIATAVLYDGTLKSFKLEPGWNIAIHVDTWAIAGTALFRMKYEREYIY